MARPAPTPHDATPSANLAGQQQQPNKKKKPRFSRLPRSNVPYSPGESTDINQLLTPSTEEEEQKKKKTITPKLATFVLRSFKVLNRVLSFRWLKRRDDVVRMCPGVVIIR